MVRIGVDSFHAMPTETVYGLGANALDPIAVAKVFAAKERPTFDPLIVHVADRGALDDLLTARALTDPRIATLADALWPGPLTIVAEASPASFTSPNKITSRSSPCTVSRFLTKTGSSMPVPK